MDPPPAPHRPAASAGQGISAGALYAIRDTDVLRSPFPSHVRAQYPSNRFQTERTAVPHSAFSSPGLPSNSRHASHGLQALPSPSAVNGSALPLHRPLALRSGVSSNYAFPYNHTLPTPVRVVATSPVHGSETRTPQVAQSHLYEAGISLATSSSSHKRDSRMDDDARRFESLVAASPVPRVRSLDLPTSVQPVAHQESLLSCGKIGSSTHLQLSVLTFLD